MDWRAAVPLHRHQLHRPSNAQRARTDAEDRVRWTNADFALVIISFRVAYTLGQAGAGRFLDAVGTRMGLSVTVAFYSIAAMLTSLAGGLRFILLLPIPARYRRSGQLARRDQGGRGMVSET